MFPIWLVMGLVATAFVGYGTFRYGIWAVLTGDEWLPRLLFGCLMALASLWRARPKKKPNDQIRLNLN